MRVFSSVFAIILSATLASCSYLSFSDGVDYSGPYENQVGACAELAMTANLRNDDRIVSTIWVRNVAVDATSEQASGTTRVSGETHTSDSAPRIYAWTCDVKVDYQKHTLTANITSFNLVKP